MPLKRKFRPTRTRSMLLRWLLLLPNPRLPAVLIGAPVFVTPTTWLPKKLLTLLRPKSACRYSILALRLLVNANSPPTPAAQPTLLLLLLPKPRKPFPLLITTAPAAAAAGLTKNAAGIAVLPMKPL